jgi:hypothetical protein
MHEKQARPTTMPLWRTVGNDDHRAPDEGAAMSLPDSAGPLSIGLIPDRLRTGPESALHKSE